MGRRKTGDQLTPLELEIMKVLWEAKAATVQEVQARLGGEPLAYTTVQTMLNVLHRKGRVNRELRDRAYVYCPTIDRVQAMRQAVGDLIDRLFGGSPESLVLGLVETEHLTRADLARLGRLVAEDRAGDAHTAAAEPPADPPAEGARRRRKKTDGGRPGRRR